MSSACWDLKGVGLGVEIFGRWLWMIGFFRWTWMGCRDGRRRVEFESGSSSLDLTGVVSGLENFESWVRMICFFFLICGGYVHGL